MNVSELEKGGQRWVSVQCLRMAPSASATSASLLKTTYIYFGLIITVNTGGALSHSTNADGSELIEGCSRGSTWEEPELLVDQAADCV